jgi:catechol 2,3-dioxygenase
MDTPNASAVPTAASFAPIHIGAVGILVRDLDRMTAYYRDILGLALLERTPSVAILGTGGVALIELIRGRDALPDDPREAGLYHMAFLMPTRADLARWILHVAKNRVPITGASDHDVSEAIYLDDPEGNGVEVYSDRPRDKWRRDGKLIFQKTDPLDIDAIISEIDPKTATYCSAPEGLRIGHVHLRVGDVSRAEAFYCAALGLDVTRRRPGATFLSSGGYHHHIAANVWHSDGAGPRNSKRTGLDWFAIESNDAPTLDKMKTNLAAIGVRIDPIRGGFAAIDPWGTRIRFTTVHQSETAEKTLAPLS